jgi:hypothetical protein
LAFNLENDTYSVPIGLGIGQGIEREEDTFNVFIEPQWSIAGEGAGWPKWQVCVGVNPLFK